MLRDAQTTPYRLQAQAAAAEAAAADNAQLGEEEEEEEGSSEWETDSEDEDGPGHTMMKPVFVPKTDREVTWWVVLRRCFWCFVHCENPIP